MIRENTLTTATHWEKPLVSEVAEVLNLLREYGYESATLVKLTGLSERKLCDWTARYKKEPHEVSTIPYPCWCFLAALVGHPNIQNNGEAYSVDARKFMRAFKPDAFLPANTFAKPTSKQLQRVIGEETFTKLSVADLADIFNWKPGQFQENLDKGNLPFLNWSLILMYMGFNIQKMILVGLDSELKLS